MPMTERLLSLFLPLAGFTTLPEGVSRHPKDRDILLVGPDAGIEGLKTAFSVPGRKAVIWKRKPGADATEAARSLTPDQLRTLSNVHETAMAFLNGALMYPQTNKSFYNPTKGLNNIPTPIMKEVQELAGIMEQVAPTPGNPTLMKFTAQIPGNDNTPKEEQSLHVDRGIRLRAVTVLAGSGMLIGLGPTKRYWFNHDHQLRSIFRCAVSLETLSVGDVAFFEGSNEKFSNVSRTLLHQEPDHQDGKPRFGMILTK